MNESARLTKNAKIKETLKATRKRRASMICRVFELKVQKGKMPKKQKDDVFRLFLEAKWLYNAAVFSDDIFSFNCNTKSVSIKCGSGFEDRLFSVISSQIKQSVIDRAKNNIRGLSVLKANGRRTGRLKGKKSVNSIPLKQFGTTFRIDFGKELVMVQNIKKPFRVRGLAQIPEGADIADCKLVRKPSGLYFHVTCFTEKENRIRTDKCVGLDFGIKDNITTSDGEHFNISVKETKRVKKASRAYNKGLRRNGNNKRSRLSVKRKHALLLAYEKQSGIKNDQANKIVSYLFSEYDMIAIQDDMIANWHKGLFGRGVQHSAMGKVKAKLKDSPQTVTVSRSYPSTQICPECGCLTKHPLSEREYDCKHCGYHHPSRDIKSAQSILDYALKKSLSGADKLISCRDGGLYIQESSFCCAACLQASVCEAGSPILSA